MSAIDVQSRSTLIAPASRRVICSSLLTRSDSSRDWSNTLRARACRASGCIRSPDSTSVDEAPAIAASGVRRSCEIDASSALRMRSRLGLDLEQRLLAGLAAAAVDEAGRRSARHPA